MATFVVFDEFAENISGTINLNSDTFKLALTDSAPIADTHEELPILRRSRLVMATPPEEQR
jgi:hypothetical protein